MSQFTVDAVDTIEQIEERLTGQMVELGAELVVDELVLLLRGWMEAAGRERPWRDDLTADSMAEKLKFFGRYVNIAPEVERLWHRLRRFVPALHRRRSSRSRGGTFNQMSSSSCAKSRIRSVSS